MKVATIATARRSAIRGFTQLRRVPLLSRVADTALRRLFNAVAPTWDRIRADPVYADAFTRALARARAREGFPDGSERPLRILDVACGTGLATRLLVDSFPGAQVTGIDIAPDMVELAHDRVPEAQFVTIAAGPLPFAADSFDVVTSLDGVFDVAELARVCAPDGAILIVYSRGGSIPVRRDPDAIARELGATGYACTVERGDSWVVSAVRGT